MAQRKSFTEKTPALAVAKPKTRAQPPKLPIVQDAQEVQDLRARVKELEDGVKFILDRFRYGGDWVSINKCRALLSRK